MTDGPSRFDWERVIRSARLAEGTGGASVPLVALVLATYASADGGDVRPAQQTIADGLGMSVDTVRRAVNRLREAGFLEQARAPGPGRPAEYRLTLPSPAPVPPLPGTGAPLPLHQCSRGTAPVQPNQYKDQYKDQNKRPDQETPATADPWEEAERAAALG